MKEQVKELWTKALRSGEYKQGQGSLNCNGKFCCLGVLTDLYIKAMGSEWESRLIGEGFTFGGHSAVLSENVAKWSGMKTSTGLFNGGTLAILNDIGSSFESIADVIEKNYEDL